MKKFYLLLLAIIFATTATAQMQLATLIHNDSVSVYYGTSALQQAYNAACNGDIITLSSGTFNSPGTIDKAITLRGAGMYVDTSTGTLPTIINEAVSFANDGTINSHITLEGIKFNRVTYGNVNYLDVRKCEINTLAGKNINGAANGSSNLSNSIFSNCIIANAYFNHTAWYGTWRTDSYIRNCNFVNSVILDIINGGVSGLSNSITNCVVYLSPVWAQFFTISNSILITQTSGECSSQNVYHCIGISLDDQDYFDDLTSTSQQCHNFSSLTEVFNNYNGTYNSGSTTFELNDSISESHLGVDGSQIGIYGGAMPFIPFIQHPLIRRCNVASRSTIDGKLAVDIEIVSE